MNRLFFAALISAMPTLMSVAAEIDVNTNDLDRGVFVTNDPVEFDESIKGNVSSADDNRQTDLHVSLEELAGKFAPFSTNDGTTIYGDAYVSTSSNVLQPGSALLVNRDLEITFPHDVSATAFYLCNWDVEGSNFHITLLDTNGHLITTADSAISSGGNTEFFLGLHSAQPFRSILISNSAESWMLSELSYDGPDVAMVARAASISAEQTRPDNRLPDL